MRPRSGKQPRRGLSFRHRLRRLPLRVHVRARPLHRLLLLHLLHRKHHFALGLESLLGLFSRQSLQPKRGLRMIDNTGM